MAKQFTGMFLAVTMALSVGTALAEDHSHHHFPKDIDAFHALLAPVWHARPGNERSQDACAKAAGMEQGARDISSADAAALQAAVVALKTTCASNPAGVDAALFDVHEAFHRLIDVKPAAAR